MFKSQNFCHIASNNRNNVKAGMFIYRTTDDLATVTANGYFNDRIIDLNLHDIIVHEQIDNADPTKVKQNFLCVVQKTLTNINTKIMDTDEVDGADTDLSNLSDTGKANISAKGTYDPNATYDAGTVGEAITGKASTDLSNLTATGANIANWSSNVSNCITEISQDIKLELNNGTLILKSGSKVYVPNGDGVFDTVTTTQDLSITISGDGQKFIYKNPGNYINYQAITTSVSGTTDSLSGTPWHLWYDTTNNVINRYGADGTTAMPGQSLPIAIVTVSGGAISSIDQVFNGFGFVGSTVFVLPGVKGLIPNGRNADGTLKNNIMNVSAVKIRNFTGSERIQLLLGPDGYVSWFSVQVIKYDETNNIVYRLDTGEKQVGCIGGYFDISSDKITSLKVKTAFHAVDYNDSDYIANCAMPSNRYVNLTYTQATFTAPADGYWYANKLSGAAGESLVLTAVDSGYEVADVATDVGYRCRVLLPVTKGSKMYLTSNLTGSGGQLKFFYANGSK